jgi:uncharacterized membrane protein
MLCDCCAIREAFVMDTREFKSGTHKFKVCRKCYGYADDVFGRVYGKTQHRMRRLRLFFMNFLFIGERIW